jgi:phospholipase/lecithinase/hemolysin
MNTPALLTRLGRAVASALAPVLLAFAVTSSIHAAPPPAPAPFSSIQVLGDSLSDTGRMAAVMTQLTGQPFPPAPYYQGRFSNGPLWIEQLAPKLGRTYQPLDNFAWAGATTGRANVFGPPFPGMLDELDELRAPAAPLDAQALYVVFGGSNDFLAILNGGNPQVLIGNGVVNLLGTVAQLHAAGARHIVVVDLPDIGLTPRARAGGPAASAGATYLSTVFNTLLRDGLKQIGVPVVHVSAFKLLNHMVAHPKAYGFTDVTSPAYYNPAAADTFLFWDDIHPTTRAHGFIAEAIRAELVDVGLVRAGTP